MVTWPQQWPTFLEHLLRDRQVLWRRTCINPFTFHSNLLRLRIYYPFLFIDEEARLREVKQSPQGHSADKRLSQNWNTYSGLPGPGFYWWRPHSVQFSSVAQSCPTLCDLMDCSMPGLPVHLQLLQFTQTHVHWVGDIAHKSAQSLGEERTLTLVGPLKDAVHILVHLIFTMNLGGKYMILLFYRWEKGVQRGWVIGKDRLFTTPQMLLNVIRDD